MAMQMIHAGGVEALTDQERQADADNPRGYFEYERVKALRNDKAWLDEAQGKVQSQPVAAVAVVGQAHRFEPLTSLFANLGKISQKWKCFPRSFGAAFVAGKGRNA
jgi:hypothetical protein